MEIYSHHRSMVHICYKGNYEHTGSTYYIITNRKYTLHKWQLKTCAYNENDADILLHSTKKLKESQNRF